MKIESIDKDPEYSNRSIMRATAILGSSSFIQLLASIIRTKLLAILLGPSGIGLASVLNNFMATSSTFFDMGAGTSATREIAESGKSEHKIDTVGKAKHTIIKLSWILGIIACISTIIFSKQVSIFIFGDDNFKTVIKILAFGILFNVVANVQVAFLNGLRRIGDLAKCTVIGSVFGTLVAVLIAWKYREAGVVYYVITVPIITYLTTLYFIHRLGIKRVKISSNQFSIQAIKIMQLGVPLMLAAVLGQLTMLAIRGQIVIKLGLSSVGLFEVAWGITGTYIGLVLSAMVREYYPRLVTLSNDQSATNAAVNQQALIALWLTTPLLLGISALAPLVISTLYSSEFLLIADTLRWMALGTVLKVVVWAMGFVWLSRGLTKYVMFDAILGNFILFGGVTIFLDTFGIDFIGWLYTFNYVIIFFCTKFFVKKISGFIMQRNVQYELFILITACILCIPLNHYIASSQAMIIGALLTAALSLRAALKLHQLYTTK